MTLCSHRMAMADPPRWAAATPRQGPCTKKTTMDEALHALEGDVRTTPQIHWRWGRLDAGSTTAGIRRQGTLGDWWRRTSLRRHGCKVWNPRGEPFGFIGVTGARKPTTHLDLCACQDLPQCPTAGRVHAISIRSLRKLTGRFASLD